MLQDIGIRFSIVHAHRQLDFLGPPQLLTEDLQLQRPILRIPDIVQAYLTNRNDFRTPKELFQSVGLLWELASLMRMRADGCVHLIELFGQLNATLARGEVRTYGKNSSNPRPSSALDDEVHIRLERGRLEMRMRVHVLLLPDRFPWPSPYLSILSGIREIKVFWWGDAFTP